MKLHKQGKQTVTKYIGFGRYEEIPSPICVGAKAVYSGYSFAIVKRWKSVTCKHCLSKNIQNNKIGGTELNFNGISYNRNSDEIFGKKISVYN